MTNPATTGRMQGSKGKSLPASFPTSTSIVPDLQEALAVQRLVTRFGLAPSTASAVATANGWGGPNG